MAAIFPLLWRRAWNIYLPTVLGFKYFLVLLLISNIAIDEEGIFRLSGSALDIERMRVKADQGLELNFNGMNSDALYPPVCNSLYLSSFSHCIGVPYHNVSGIFKLFIRSLPVPLVTYELHNAFLNATSIS